MQPPNDLDLLAEYNRTRSDQAFARIVERYAPLVYSSALRQVNDPHLAEEVAQAVFIILTRKSARLSAQTILSGWLCRTACFVARDALKAERRRIHREQLAAQMNDSLSTHSDADAWNQLSPILDEAIAHLREKDRNAIVLRFYEQRPFDEVGRALGIGQDAAQKRVSRALEKLRNFFSRRGVTITSVAIAGTISANAVHAAPAAIVTSITGATTQGAAISTSLAALTQHALKAMAWANLKLAAALTASLVIASVVIAVTLNSNSRDAEALRILNQARQKYASLSSYSSTGETTQIVGDRTLTASFTMRLARSNLYLVEYEQHGPGLTNKGAAWCDGTGEYFANDIVGQTTKMPYSNLAHHLGDIWDVSGGVSLVVPGLFFNTQIPQRPPDTDKLNLAFDAANPSTMHITPHLRKEPDEKIGDVVCYVLSLEKDGSARKLWIGKDDFLIHQSEENLNSKTVEMTDAEAAALLASAPGKLTVTKEELRKRVNEARKEAASTKRDVTVILSQDHTPGLKSIQVSPPPVNIYTQTHKIIAVNQPVTPADFRR